MKNKKNIWFIKVCAWCTDKEQKEKEAEKQGFAVSHGMCKKCAKLYFNDK